MLPQTLSRRTLWIVAVAGAIALVGAVLRVSCVGAACDRTGTTEAATPFCGLDEGVRRSLVDGHRDGRSPEVLTVTGSTVVTGGTAFDVGGPPWPAVSGGSAEVPLAFVGEGLETGRLQTGTSLDRVAPTLAAAAGLERAHPEVRSGTDLGIFSTGSARLLVIVAWKGAGPAEAAASEVFSGALSGAGTPRGSTGSLPADPAAVLTTVGTGGLPRQHGITGSILRNESGRLVAPWRPDSPPAVIAALGDDLDRADPSALIGLVGTDRLDRGLIGQDWYLTGDMDEANVVAPDRVLDEALRLLRTGFGADQATDLLAVTVEGDPSEFDEIAGPLLEEAARRSDGAFVGAILGTGASPSGDLDADAIATHVEDTVGSPVIEGIAPGGLYLDQDVLAEQAIAQDEIRRALGALRHDGSKVFRDVFGAIAVSLERYC